MQRILLLVGLIATGLVAAPSVAAQQACAVGSTLQFSPVSGQSQCAMAPGAFTLAPGQLFLGGPIMTRPDFYTGGLYGTSSYGSGGASVRPGGWFPQVAGAPDEHAKRGNCRGLSHVRSMLQRDADAAGRGKPQRRSRSCGA